MKFFIHLLLTFSLLVPSTNLLPHFTSRLNQKDLLAPHSIVSPIPSNPMNAMQGLISKEQQGISITTHPIVKEQKDALNIVMITPETLPFFKEGGMADYVNGLSIAHAQEGQKITVISPLYQVSKEDAKRRKEGKRSLREELIQKYDIRPIDSIEVQIGNFVVELGVYKAFKEVEGVTHYFLDHGELFHLLYGDVNGTPGLEKAVALSRGAIQLMQKIDLQPDIIHTNDWMAALIPAYLKTDGRYINDFRQARTVHTIHNSGAGYQGRFSVDDYPILDLWDNYLPGLALNGVLNLTKGAVATHADHVVTVSPGFREETLSPVFSHGLEKELRQLGPEEYQGIVNGTDLAKWRRKLDAFGGLGKGKERAKVKLIQGINKQIDKQKKSRIEAILKRRDLHDWQKVEMVRAIAERLDQRKMTLDPEAPIMGMVTRIVEQKGIKSLMEQIHLILEKHPTLRFVLLGTGDYVHPEWQQEAGPFLDALNDQFPGRVSVTIAFDRELAEDIMLGSDMFLMPSVYEPCGISQLDAMACAAVPIVRATGGLKDTVTHYGTFKLPHEEGYDPFGDGTGILFGDNSGEEKSHHGQAMVGAIDYAVWLYTYHKEHWATLMANGLKKADVYTWNRASQEYIRLYLRMLGRSPELPIDKEEQLSPSLYPNISELGEEMVLDHWDQQNYHWDGSYWRSNHFPKLILGDKGNIQLDEEGQLVHHVAIRMRAGWTLYILDDQKWSFAYTKEAQARGEVPRYGNEQIYIANEAGHGMPDKLPKPTRGASQIELSDYSQYVEKIKDLNNLNALLGKDKTVRHHYWFNGKKGLNWHTPLGGEATAFATTAKDYFKIDIGPDKTAIVNIDMGSMFVDGKLQPAAIRGVLNRLDQEGIIPLTMMFSANFNQLEVLPTVDNKRLFTYFAQGTAERFAETFSEKNLIRSLEVNGSFRHWKLVFQRLSKLSQKKDEKIELRYESHNGGILTEALTIPRELFETKNLYLAVRYITARIYNRAIMQGVKKVSIGIHVVSLDPNFIHKFNKQIQSELAKKMPALMKFANFNQPFKIDITEGKILESQKKAITKIYEKSKLPPSKDHVAFGIHVRGDEARLVVLKGGQIIYRKKTPIQIDRLSGAILRDKIVQLARGVVEELSLEKVHSIGVSFPGPVHENQVIRLLNFERVTLSRYAKEERDQLDFTQAYIELNQLESKLKAEFQNENLEKVTILNNTNALAFEEIKTRTNGSAFSAGRKFLLTVGGAGTGAATIRNGAVIKGANEGGHLIVKLNGENVCQACGGAGCLEEYVSNRMIIRLAEDFGVEFTESNNKEKVKELVINAMDATITLEKLQKRNRYSQTPFDIKNKITANDRKSKLVIDHLVDVYADAIAEFDKLFDIDQFVLGGDLMLEKETSEFLIQSIKKSLEANYPELIKDDKDFIIKAKADLEFGSAMGVARYSLEQVNQDKSFFATRDFDIAI